MAVRKKSIGFDIREYGKILFKRRWTMGAFFLIVVTVVTIGTLIQKPVFKATAVIQILPEAPNVVNFQEVIALGSNNYWALKEYYETQFRIIRSRSIATVVLDELKLRDTPPYKGAKDPEALLTDQIRVEPVKNSQLVAVSVEHSDPERAAAIANAVSRVYKDQNLGRKSNASTDALAWLKGEGKDMEQSLQASEAKLHKFMNDSQVFSFDEKFNIALRNLARFSEALAEAKRQRLETEALYNHISEMLKNGKAMEIPSVRDNALISGLKSEKVLAEKKLAELKLKYKEAHPDIQSLETQISLLGKKIQDEIDNLVGSVKAELEIARDREAGMVQAVNDARAQAQDLSEKEIQYKILKRDVDGNQLLFDELQKRAKETQITKKSTANNIIIIEEARVPEHHIRPQRRVNILLGMLLGALGGVGLAFLLEFLDNTIKTQADIEAVTDVPFLGIIPSFQEEGEAGQKDLFTHYYPKSSITESCRAIRTNIIYSSPDKELRKLLVTSAGPQEGKSTTVINLGIIFAQGGRRVLLVDSDLRRPRLHKAFNIERARGLTNVVMGETTLEEAVVATEVPNLFIIPSGPVPPNPAEMLGSPRVQEIIAEMQARYDLVLFDSPPIVAVTDAVVLSKSVDGVVLVVKAGKTTTDLFTKALRQIEDVNSHVLGSVLNDFNFRGEGYHYYYYYHYYRGEEDAGPDGRRVRKRHDGAHGKSA